MALCITEDHGQQLKVWKAARSPWEQRPDMLRRLMTKNQVSLASDPVGMFVGADAYEAAGGTIVRDLFAENAEGFVSDKVLLHKLAQEKLDAIAEPIKAEGWAWVETRTEFDSVTRSGYAQCPLVKKKVAEASRPFAGAVVCITRGGEVEVIRGLMKPDDRKAHAKALKQAEKAKEATKARAKEGDAAGQAEGTGSVEPAAGADVTDISRALSLRLGAQRTAALQLQLARNTSLALACLAHTLVRDVFGAGLVRGHDPLQIAARPVRGDALVRGDASVQSSRACTELQAVLDGWGERLPEDDEALLPWLIALPSDQLLKLIASCVAASATTVLTQTMEATPLFGYGLRVAQAAGLDMAQWWEPTGDTYLASVSKAHVIAVVREVRGAQACIGLDKLAKGELVAKAETLLQGSGWLPELLRLKPEEVEVSADQ